MKRLDRRQDRAESTAPEIIFDDVAWKDCYARPLGHAMAHELDTAELHDASEAKTIASASGVAPILEKRQLRGRVEQRVSARVLRARERRAREERA